MNKTPTEITHLYQTKQEETNMTRKYSMSKRHEIKHNKSKLKQCMIENKFMKHCIMSK